VEILVRRRYAILMLAAYLILLVLVAARGAAASSSAAAKRYYHADGYIKAIGKNARRTIYHPDPRVSRRWRRDLRYLERVRENAWRVLHPVVRPAPLVDGCLSRLIGRESGWNVYATNPSSGAYGLPQALPGSKMASAGPDWRTNPATQIRWMLGYVRHYGGSCGAEAFQLRNGWY
jgi:hypothetical protein